MVKEGVVLKTAIYMNVRELPSLRLGSVLRKKNALLRFLLGRSLTSFILKSAIAMLENYCIVCMSFVEKPIRRLSLTAMEREPINLNVNGSF